MKKYTLKVRILDSSVTVASFRMAIENILLYTYPSITYRLGLIVNTDSDSYLVEIASDGKKAVLASRLKSIEDKLPVTIETLGWGWIADDNLRQPNKKGLLEDPLAAIESETVPYSFLFSGKVFAFRYISLLSLTFLLVALGIIGVYLASNKPFELECVYFAVFLLWIISLSDLSLDIRPHLKKIDCELAELALTAWFRNKVVRMNWETIWGLEYNSPAICIIHYDNNKSFRFLVNSGIKNKYVLLKTIIQKASLNHVESVIGRAVYKRYDAP